MKELAPSPRTALELLCLFDNICRKYHLKYTLTEDTLLGAVRNKGFLPWAATVKVAMLQPDYLSFRKAASTELTNTEYYFTDFDLRRDIRRLCGYLVKKSRVVLPEYRCSDKFYYDFTIQIIPVLGISDKKQTYIHTLKSFCRCNNIVNVRKTAFFHCSIKYLIKWARRAPIQKQDKNTAFRAIRETFQNARPDVQYVLYPGKAKRYLGSISSLRTYQDLEEIWFEGKRFYAIADSARWLKEYYGKICFTEKYSLPPNLMLLKGPEELRRVQLVQLEILKEIDRICRKYKIAYFICSGTLLGAVRHGGFIPWDYDADVAMSKKDYDFFLQVCEKEFDKEKYFVRNIKNEPTIHITYTQIRRIGTSFIRAGRENNKKAHHGILVDIFPLYTGAPGFLRHFLQTKICMFYKTMFWTHNGARSEKHILKRCFYLFLSKFPPSFSFNQYMKYAVKFEGARSKKVAWLVAKNNPYFSPFTDRQVYVEREDICFEGHPFQTIKNKEAYLQSIYTDEYMLYPPEGKRQNGFLPSGFDAGDLYPYEGG